MKKKHFVIALIVLLQVVLLFYLRFTAWPEMTLWPYLITKGWFPYKNIAIAHTPLMLIDLSIFYKIFGVGILQLKIFTWILILLFDYLVYQIAKKLWKIKTAIIALSVFAVWQLFYSGNGLWFDLYMGIFALCSFYFVKQKKWLLAGLVWALAFISKQTAVWFLLPIGFELINSKRVVIKKNTSKLILGILSVISIFILGIWLFGIFPSFWNWAVKFGLLELPGAQGQIQLPALKNLIVSAFPFLIFIPLIWKTGRKNTSLLFWAAAGALGVYPRFEYFHFQPAIPFLAFGIAEFFSGKSWKNKQTKKFSILYILGCIYLFGGFFMSNFREGTRFYEKNVVEVARFVKSNTNPNDKIFVMNWWDNIYALSGTLPAVDPWVPQLSWYTEIPGVQEKMIDGLEASKPKLIILNPYTGIGLSAYIPQKVYNYVLANYELKEKVDGVEILIPKSKTYANSNPK